MGSHALNPDAPGARTTKGPLDALVGALVEEAVARGDESPDLDLETLRAAVCRVCRRPLTDPASIAEGVGPVCAGKRPGSWLGRGGPRA